jgi:hypothetical protein
LIWQEEPTLPTSDETLALDDIEITIPTPPGNSDIPQQPENMVTEDYEAKLVEIEYPRNDNFDFPITLRKGTRSRTLHPMSK